MITRAIAPSPEELFERKEQEIRQNAIISAVLYRALDRISYNIVCFRFGLGTHTFDPRAPMTFSEIAKLYNTDYEKVYAKFRKALRILQHPSNSRQLKEFANLLPEPMPEPIKVLTWGEEISRVPENPNNIETDEDPNPTAIGKSVMEELFAWVEDPSVPRDEIWFVNPADLYPITKIVNIENLDAE